MKRTALTLISVAMIAAVATWYLSGKPAAPSRARSVETPPGGGPAKATGDSARKVLPSASLSPQPVPSSSDIHTMPPSQAVRDLCVTVFKIGNGTERKVAFEKLLASTHDVTGLKAILENFNSMFKAGRRFDSEWTTFWQTIGHRDPEGTMALIESYGSDTTWYESAVKRTLNEWASVAPEAAMKWLDDNKVLSGESFDDAALSLVSGYAARDLEAATAYAIKVFNPGLYGSAKLNMLLSRAALQQRGTDGMIAWFKAMPEGDEKTAMFNSVANRLNEVDPAKKRAWLEAEARQPYRNDISYRDLVQEIATADPRAGMDYLARLPRSPRDGGMPGVGAAAFAWLDKDVAEFAAYYRALPPGDLRTNIVKAITNSLQNDAKLAESRRTAATQFLQTIKP